MSSSILARLDITGPQVLAISLAIVFIFYRLLIYDARRKHLPKGPKGWPIVDNTFQLSMTNNPGPQLIEGAEQYGEMFYLRLGATDFIFLNSGRVVKELLDKRGSIYSDKPRLPMAGEAYTRGLNLALMRYDQRWNVVTHDLHANPDSSTTDARNVDAKAGGDLPTDPTIRVPAIGG